MLLPRRLSIVVALAAGASWMLAGCGGTGCKPLPLPGLHVTVLDGPGGLALCGVTVRATEGAYTEVLAASPPGGLCYYDGAQERVGVYTVEATFEGRTATLSNVPVIQGECHVVQSDVTIVLPAAALSESPL